MTDRIQAKLDDLETLIAHQGKEITELNEVVTAQANEIDTLKKYIKIKLDKIDNSLRDIDDSEHKSVSDEAAANKPPHY
jgi:uncharacterized coiled-coil protein SlyX